MYRRIVGFFGGAMSESSEDTNQERNNEGNERGETLGSTRQVAQSMAGGEQGALRERIQKLEQELKVRIEESENYKNRLQLVEKELGILQTIAVPPPISKVSTGVGDGVVEVVEVSNENRQEMESFPNTENSNLEKLVDENSGLRVALTKAGELLKDKTELCDNQEKKNVALTNQIESLKEVVAITKDLLNIRNMEVQHLQSDVESMEEKIANERQRHNSMITKMDEAVKLNSDLKGEYENQLGIFQSLKSRYEEKVALLTKENKKLEEKVSLSNNVPNTALQVTNINLASEETDTQ